MDSAFGVTSWVTVAPPGRHSVRLALLSGGRANERSDKDAPVPPPKIKSIPDAVKDAGVFLNVSPTRFHNMGTQRGIQPVGTTEHVGVKMQESVMNGNVYTPCW